MKHVFEVLASSMALKTVTVVCLLKHTLTEGQLFSFIRGKQWSQLQWLSRTCKTADCVSEFCDFISSLKVFKQLNQQYTMQACLYESLTLVVKTLNERELFIYLYLCVCSTLGEHILFRWESCKIPGCAV